MLSCSEAVRIATAVGYAVTGLEVEIQSATSCLDALVGMVFFPLRLLYPLSVEYQATILRTSVRPRRRSSFQHSLFLARATQEQPDAQEGEDVADLLWRLRRQ